MSNLPDTELGQLSSSQARRKVTSEHNENLLKRSERVNEKTAEERLQSLRSKIKDEMAKEVELGHEVSPEGETGDFPATYGLDNNNTDIFNHTEAPQYKSDTTEYTEKERGI